MDRLRSIRMSTATALRLLVSFVLALLLWGWVTDQADPTIPRNFANVPLQEPPLPEPLLLVGQLEAVTVRVEGPRSVVTNLTADDLEPRLDLSEVDGPGEYTVSVRVDAPGAVRIERITPRQVSIIVDRPASRSFHLDIPPPTLEDNTRRLGDVVPEVSEVTVSGPERFVDEVERVVLPVEIGERTSDFTAVFEPVAVNGEGEQITEVEIRPERVAVRVEVEARGRSVPVLIQTVGSPAAGYEVVDRAVNPAMVLLDGPEATLDAIVSVSTAPVNIDGATEQVSRRVGLTGLPSGVGVVEPADGRVVVVIEVRQRSVAQTLADQPVVVTDVAPGLEAVAEPPALGVVVFAAEDALADLEASDVTIRVSAKGLGPGTHELSPTVTVPPGVQWIRTEPAAVRVTLRPASATPAASPVAVR